MLALAAVGRAKTLAVIWESRFGGEHKHWERRDVLQSKGKLYWSDLAPGVGTYELICEKTKQIW